MSERGIERGQTRAGGRTVADEVAREGVEEVTSELEEAVLDIERAHTFVSPGLSRMRIEWTPEHRSAISEMHVEVGRVLDDRFRDLFALINEVYELVREPKVDEATGEVMVDQWGWNVWKQNQFGNYIEDWSLLTNTQRENFLFQVTVGSFVWQQQAADLWGEAMFAKGVWTESFAAGFDRPRTGTVDHRTARGNLDSAEDRYFAVYLSLLSRKADALVRSAELISQRIKDTLREG